MPDDAFAESAKAWRAERDRSDPIDWAKPIPEPPASAPTLAFLDLTDDEEPPPQEWTVPDRFPRRETCLFSGQGGAGKSTIGLHLCAAHVLGKDWMLSSPELGPAMFLDAEDDEGVVRRRLWAIKQHYGAKGPELGELHIASLHGKDALLAQVAKGGKIEPTKLYDQVMQAARLFNPQTIVIASVANVYGGDEINRAQVTQFIGLMNALAIEANGSVILISHPSVTGVATDTGISGSTQWHNAVRARMYLKSPKANGAEEPQEIKQLEFLKNQYGKLPDMVTVRWKDGLFLPDASPPAFERAARDAAIDAELPAMIARLERAEHYVSATPSANNYAPKVLAGEAEAIERGWTKPELKAALARVLANGRIHIVTYGKASNPHQRLTIYSNGPA